MIHNDIIEHHYKAHRERLVKVVLRRVGWDYHLAEEAVQEAYTRALKHIHVICYRPDKEFDYWFITILNNVVKDIMKIERYRGMTLDDLDDSVHLNALENVWDTPTGNYGVDTNLYRRQILKKIIKMENELHRECLELYVIHGLNYVDILTLTKASSQSMVRKVVSRFKESLKEE